MVWQQVEFYSTIHLQSSVAESHFLSVKLRVYDFFIRVFHERFVLRAPDNSMMKMKRTKTKGRHGGHACPVDL